LRGNDTDRHQARAEVGVDERQLLADERQYGGVGEMKQHRRDGKHQQRPTCQQDCQPDG
jgi:hypothetical protein